VAAQYRLAERGVPDSTAVRVDRAALRDLNHRVTICCVQAELLLGLIARTSRCQIRMDPSSVMVQPGLCATSHT
jgi:hypothetical protein